MPSEAKGKLFVPVWVDSGVVKALIDNAGKLPCAVDITGQTVDITGQTVNITGQTVDISGQHINDDSDYKHTEILTIYGGAWRNQPMIWGFHDTVRQLVYTLTAAAGRNDLSTTVVPAGEIHKIENIAFVNRNNNCTGIIVDVFIDAGLATITARYAPQANEVDTERVSITLGPGDYLRCRFEGCVLNDDLEFHLVGYKMSYA